MLRAVHNLPLPMVPTVHSRIVRDIVVVGADEGDSRCTNIVSTYVRRAYAKRFKEMVLQTKSQFQRQLATELKRIGRQMLANFARFSFPVARVLVSFRWKKEMEYESTRYVCIDRSFHL